jgi:hypothetical protein
MAVGVGSWNPFKKIAVRAPVNEYDKSTLFNIYFKEFNERKITLQPDRYVIPAGSFEAPSRLVIGPASWWREVNENEPLLEIPTPSAVLAESIVRDAVAGMLGCDNVRTMPGLFWLPHDVSVEELKSKYLNHLLKARENQHRYFQKLVELADSFWARTNGNPLAIHHDAKIAAQALGMDREWVTATAQFAPQVVRCVACGSMRNPDYPVCPVCKAVVDVEKAKTLKLKFAE